MATAQFNDPQNANNVDGRDLGLVSYVMDLVKENRNSRDRQHKERWDAYERTYRGFFRESDRTRKNERSRLIAPALAQAIDSTAASIEDAIFGRDQWFEALDDIADSNRDDIEQARLRLKEDLELTNVPEAIAKVVLNGCIYGTGIAKINITRKEVRRFANTVGGAQVQSEIRPVVTVDPIPPWEYVIDAQARDQDSASFEAHETHVPRTKVWEKQRKGVYRNVDTSGYNTSKQPFPAGVSSTEQTTTHRQWDGAVWVTEFYGLVPAHLLRPHVKEIKPTDIRGGNMVEAIVVIANESELLKAIVNPFWMKDRPIVAYQHDAVPGKFWGRGVAEKGWNAQRALDAELRARMDALALLTSPMMGADYTRLPRNPDMEVRPGKVWLTRGRPSEVLEPVVIGNLDPNTFSQSSEMERLVQVGTGAIDSNAPLDTNRRNETASGISMIQSAALKRMRRTMWNLERQFLNPLIRKCLWRLMQFNPQRYPQDVEFVIKGTMGIVAREFEQSNLTALLSVIPPDHPVYGVIAKGVIELSGTPKRDELLKAMDAAMQPDPEMDQMQKMAAQAELEAQMLDNEKTKAEIAELAAQVKKLVEEARHERIKADLEDDMVEIQAANAVVGREKVRASFEQNKIARDRNSIERIKAKKQPTSSNK